MNATRWAAVALAAAAAAGGCNESARPPLGKVHGKVTYKGKPLTFGSVVFMPTAGIDDPRPDGPGQPSAGQIRPDGSYELTTDDPGDGAVVGESKVIVTAIAPTTGKPIIPSRYQAPASTPLSRVVKEGDNAIDIEVVN